MAPISLSLTEHFRREVGGHGFRLGASGVEGAGEGFEALGLFGESGLEREGWECDPNFLQETIVAAISRVWEAMQFKVCPEETGSGGGIRTKKPHAVCSAGEPSRNQPEYPGVIAKENYWFRCRIG